MGTRSGDLDPSVVTYIAKLRNHTVDEMEEILNKKSGVYGISEVSVDFRDIEAEGDEGNHKAILALESFAYLVSQCIAKYAVSMGGIDVITFTAGVGEKGPKSREQICNYLKFLGVTLDLEKNKIRNEEVKISTDDSNIAVYVVPTNEELLIAKCTAKFIEK